MTTSRLRSVDAARGLTVAAMLIVNDPGDWGHVYPWLEHSAWNGCTTADVIFPIFLLVVGVSATLALEARATSGTERGHLSRSILARALRLIALGVVLNVLAVALIPGREIRLLGVLQRIGICYACAGLVAVHVRSARVQQLLFAGLLALYWALLVAGGTLAPALNVADRIDASLLGRWAYTFDAASGRGQDPEGILSTLGAVATVLLGLRVGAWLRTGDQRALWIGGGIALALGALAAQLIPVNKQLWTPSFVLCTGGVGVLLLGLAHALIDVRGWPAFGESLGLNAITVYAGAWLAACAIAASPTMSALYATAFAVPLAGAGPFAASLAYAVVFTAVWWCLAIGARRRGWRWSI